MAIPIALNAERIKALVVGGGAVGTRRALALVNAGASVTVVGPNLSPDLVQAATGNERMSTHARAYTVADIEPGTIVFAATDSAEVNGQIARDAVAAGCLVNVADDPESGSFHVMAVHRTGQLTIGVSAGGVPAAATRIRDMLSTTLARGYGEAVNGLGTIRRKLIDSGRGDEWRRISDDVIDERFCESVENGEFDGRVAQWR